MSNPDILILMVNQLNGTLFPDVPADWLHTPNLNKLAARSARFADSYTASPLCAPSLPASRIDTPASTLDLTPTLAALAGVSIGDIQPWTDGKNLVPAANGTKRTSPVATEYAAEGSNARLVSLRYGKWKYNRCALDLSKFDADVRSSQARRCVVYDALRQGGYYPWDYQPLQKASERYMRNPMNLNELEQNQRYPRGD